MAFECFDILNHRAISLIGPPRIPTEGFTISFTGDYGFRQRSPSKETLSNHSNEFSELLKFCDLRILNFEYALTSSGHLNNENKCNDISIQYLKKIGIDVVSLANNHAADFGINGIMYNTDCLERAGISIMGLKSHPFIKYTSDGYKIGIYALTDLLDKLNPTDQIFTCKHRDIKTVHKLLGKCDFVIGFAHLGSRSVYPSPHELAMAKAMRNAGSNMLVCTGSHFPKGFGILKGMPVLFGLGNYIFEWGGGDTESIGMHLVANYTKGKLQQLFVIPFNNDINNIGSSALSDSMFDRFKLQFADRSRLDPNLFWADSRTHDGLKSRIRKLKPRDLMHMKFRNYYYGAGLLLRIAYKRYINLRSKERR